MNTKAGIPAECAGIIPAFRSVMGSFAFVAWDTNKSCEVQSSLQAADEQAAIASLLNRDFLVLSIREDLGKRARTRGGAVQLEELVIFTRQLATMIDAGLSLVQSLHALAEQTKHKAMRDVIRGLGTAVEGGDSFSEALQKHPKTFSRLYISMVTAGEKGGMLPEILSRLAVYLENAARLRRKVTSAMLYPTVVISVAVAITLFLLVKVVPVFGGVFESFHAKLPWPTQYLINICHFLQRYILAAIVACGAAVYAWVLFLKTPAGREIWDAYRIRLPIFGHIAHKICLARFTRTLASLIRSGVPILEVLQVVSQSAGNIVMEKALKTAAVDIERGESMSDALAKHPIFPSMILRLVSAGEQTGDVDGMLEHVSDFLDDEVQTILAGLTSLIEPILIVLLGLVVGTIAICMFLPIFKMPEIVGLRH